MDSTPTRPAALRLAQDRHTTPPTPRRNTPTKPPRLCDVDDRRITSAAQTLNELTRHPETDRASSLQEVAEQHADQPLGIAARILLREDNCLVAEDGFGGYHWIDGRLRWVSNYDGRRLQRDGVEECELLPGSVDVPVGAGLYTIHIANGWIQFYDGHRVCGTCCPRERRIIISNSGPAPDRLETVWHEIMHAFFFEYGSVAGSSERVTVEECCDFFGKGMAGVGPLKFAEIAAFVTCSAFAAPPKPATAHA